MQGDEMAKVLWDKVKEQLVTPYVDMTLLSVDLSLEHRDQNLDEPTEIAIELLKKHKIGLKCSTITPVPALVKSKYCKQLYKSASA